MAPVDQAEIQGQPLTSIADMNNVLCHLIPLSALASQEITEIFLRGSPHVEIVPDNLKQSLPRRGGSEYGIALRRSNLGKTPSRGFLFGGNASTCDIPFTSQELSDIQCRICEDEHGVLTAQDDHSGSQSRDKPTMSVYVRHPDDIEGRQLITGSPALPLKNASIVYIAAAAEASSSDWIFSVFLPVHETSEYSDIESLASVSDVPTLTSGTTFSPLGPQLDISEAMDEVAHLLLKDEVLGPFFRTSLQKTATDKAERNYTRLIIGFARDLRREAKTPIEHHVGRLVKFRARFISQTLVSAIDPSRRERTAQFENFLQQDEQRESRLEQFLKSLAITSDAVEATNNVPPPIDSDGQVSDESAQEDDLPRLSQIRDFIQLSRALVELRKRLKTFVSPDEATLEAIKEAGTRDMSVEPIRERLSKTWKGSSA